MKMGMASVEKELPPSQALDQLSRSLTSMRQRLSVRELVPCFSTPILVFGVLTVIFYSLSARSLEFPCV